jgi:uncharacterized protein (UPF0276 family)
VLARQALGLGLRVPHYRAVLEEQPEVDYFEAITENYLEEGSAPRSVLLQVSAKYPIVLHGVGLNLLGHAPLDEQYLEAVCRLADEVKAPFVTDHLCWTGAHGVSHHDLLPVPYTRELVELAAERAYAVQKRIGRPFGLENLSSYVQFETSELTEWDFYTGVLRQAGCWAMLDLNNLYVSSENHGFCAQEYLAAIDFSRVLQVHLAGHERTEQGLIDTHSRRVCDAVWALYRQGWEQGGPFPTLIEWDDEIPALSVLLSELERARVERGVVGAHSVAKVAS